MKVIKIEKSFRNGVIEHYEVVSDSHTNEYITDIVETWCERESSGQNYGYSWEWDFVDDLSTVKEVIIDKMKIIDNKISDLKSEKLEMEKYYESI